MECIGVVCANYRHTIPLNSELFCAFVEKLFYFNSLSQSYICIFVLHYCKLQRKQTRTSLRTPQGQEIDMGLVSTDVDVHI